MLKEIKDKNNFKEILNENKDLLLLVFYTDFSEKSKQALGILASIQEENHEMPLYKVDVSKVKDIHPDYGINMVPAIAVFKNGKISNIIYGSYDKNYYEMILNENDFSYAPSKKPDASTGEIKKQKRVVVYTTPTCSWCGAVKSYLKKNNISFKEIDVARDEKAGQDLMRRSGQSGVPQTEIDGRIIVGFDKPKIDAVLGIKGN